MKTLLICAIVIVGGIQLSFKLFDGAVESAQNSHTAQLIKAQHQAEL